MGPQTGRAISDKLAVDLIRLGEGYQGSLGGAGICFLADLQTVRLDVRAVCSRLRVITVAALNGNSAHIAAALSELGHVCANPGDARKAWNRLNTDAHSMIGRRGSRSVTDIARVLRSDGVTLRADRAGSPIAALERLCQRTVAVNATFSILGAPMRLPIDTAWIPITAVARAAVDANPEDTLSGLVELYHAWDRRPLDREEEAFDARTIGRFHRLAIVVAGPGMGKSTSESLLLALDEVEASVICVRPGPASRPFALLSARKTGDTDPLSRSGT